MSEHITASERVGDGFGDPGLAASVAEAVPFMQFAIEDTTHPRNLTGRMPSVDPDHWLAVQNCGVSSRALAYSLGESGYKTQLLENKKRHHMLVQVEAQGEGVLVDPTALQFLSDYEIIVSSKLGVFTEDITGPSLPLERVLIFRQEDYRTAAEWMAIIVKRYWQTKALGLYAAGLVSLNPGPIIRRREVVETSQADIERDLAQIYAPDKLKRSATKSRSDYKDKHERWKSGKPPVAA